MTNWGGAQAIQKTELFASFIFLFAILKNGLCLRPLLQRQNRSLSSEAHFRTPHDGGQKIVTVLDLSTMEDKKTVTVLDLSTMEDKKMVTVLDLSTMEDKKMVTI